MKAISSAWMIIVSLGYCLSVQAQVLPDPTRPATFAVSSVVQELPAELIDWKVTAIRISEGDRTAIVNDHIVRAGETLGPARIVEIQPAQVVIDYDNRMVAVRLFADIALRKPVLNQIRTTTPR